jgi:hypothetical protein
MHMNLKLSLLSAFAVCSASPVFATILVQESFDYTSGAANGVTTTGTGLSGSWYAGATLANGSNAVATFASTNLSFTGHFASTGGSLQIANAGGNYGEAVASATLASPLSGTTFYTSQLMLLGTNGSYYNDWAVEQRFNSVSNGNYATSSGRTEVSAFGSGSSSGRKGGASLDGSEVTQATGTLAAGTTYLLVGKYTGTSGTSLTNATVYFFDQAAYTAYLTAAQATPANADALLGSNALFSLSDSTGGTNLSTFSFLQFSIGGGPTGTFDEFRMGTDVGDVVNLTAAAVPEPASAASLAAVAALGAVAFRRKRRA